MKALAASLAILALAGCATSKPDAPAAAFRISSPQFADNAMLAPQSAGNFAKNPNCTGKNVSPALQWVNPPAGTRSYVLIWDDQAGRAGLGVSHAVVYGIPASVTSFAEGELAASPVAGKFVAGRNTLGMHWLGPCPPKGNAPQHYVLTFIASSLAPGELAPGMTRADVLKALEGGKALRAASLVFRFAQ
jgi:Raf kinase inhibitor-like YbhB/YbcL family protein